VTPTQRSLAHLREQGATVVVVERWNPFSRTRQDMFGIIDLVALLDGQTIGVQTTSLSNMSARVKKIAECEHLPALRKSGWRLLVHGWGPGSNGRYRLREIDVS
jgi:hypothetical protein